MRPLGEGFLQRYLDAEYDAIRWSVGGYRIEGPGAQLFDHIDGSHFAILGLPLLPLLAFLRERGLLDELMGVPYAEVIGDPIAHSKSPLIHKFWLEKLGIEGDYRATRVTADELPAYFAARRSDPDWRGCNVTMPLKEAAYQLLDVDPLYAADRRVKHGGPLRRHADRPQHGLAGPQSRHRHLSATAAAGRGDRSGWGGASSPPRTQS